MDEITILKRRIAELEKDLLAKRRANSEASAKGEAERHRFAELKAAFDVAQARNEELQTELIDLRHDLRERRRYEIAKEVFGALCQHPAMTTIDKNAAKTAIMAADLLLEALR